MACSAGFSSTLRGPPRRRLLGPAASSSWSFTFVRGTVRGLVRERKREGIGSVPPFRLTRLADGRLTLDRRAVTLAELKGQLQSARQEYARLGVVVRGDAHAAHQHVASVLAACREAGVVDLGISVRVAGAGEEVKQR